MGDDEHISTEQRWAQLLEEMQRPMREFQQNMLATIDAMGKQWQQAFDSAALPRTLQKEQQETEGDSTRAGDSLFASLLVRFEDLQADIDLVYEAGAKFWEEMARVWWGFNPDSLDEGAEVLPPVGADPPGEDGPVIPTQWPPEFKPADPPGSA